MQLSALRVRFCAMELDSTASSGHTGPALTTGQEEDDVLLLLLLLLLEDDDEHPLDTSEDADDDSTDESVEDGEGRWTCFGGFRSFFGPVRELKGIGVLMVELFALLHPLEVELVLLLELLLPQLDEATSACC